MAFGLKMQKVAYLEPLGNRSAEAFGPVNPLLFGSCLQMPSPKNTPTLSTPAYVA